MPDASAQDLLQAAPGPEPGAPAAKAEPVMPAGEALFNPFGTLGVVAPAHAALDAPPPEAAGLSAVLVALVAAAALVRLLLWALE